MQKIKPDEKTFRDVAEEGLLRIPAVKPLEREDRGLIGKFQDGSFALSYGGFLLYCTGRNKRGISNAHPKGLLYNDGKNLFGLGIFSREHEKEGGHLMAVAPRGKDAFGAVKKFSIKAVEAVPQLRGKLCYVRNLDLAMYKEFLAHGWLPSQEFPWHPEAFAEDNTHSNSLIKLDAFLEETHGMEQRIKNRYARLRVNAFQSFLARNGMQLAECGYDAEAAKSIVNYHFEMLGKKGKQIGSTVEDYLNLLEHGLETDFAAMYKLQKGRKSVMASVFVGEKVSEKRMALYCTITNREPEILNIFKGPKILRIFGRRISMEGFTALSSYANSTVFAEVKKRFPETEEICLGGSEHPDLNFGKRHMGAENLPEYWVVKKLE